MSDEHNKAITLVETAVPDARRMHPVVRAMVEAGPRPEDMRELLAIQREWEAGEARRAYTAALVALRADLPAIIERDKVVAYGQTRYTHASLGAVMEAITEPLMRHGFSISWEPRTGERQVTVTCRLTHCDGHSESATISAPPDTSGGNKTPAQAVASTITLLQRYSALSLIGIATADMREDGDDGVVDSARTLRALAAIRAADASVDEAEAEVGAPATEWTRAHLRLVRAWLDAQGGRDG